MKAEVKAFGRRQTVRGLIGKRRFLGAVPVNDHSDLTRVRGRQAQPRTVL